MQARFLLSSSALRPLPPSESFSCYSFYYNVCIFWNKNLTHYFVGLTCGDYTITLDPDDFFNIKDLTRLKTGLTAQGICILEDKNSVFKNELEEFNNGRSQYSIQKIADDMHEEGQCIGELAENEDIAFLKKASIITNIKGYTK